MPAVGPAVEGCELTRMVLRDPQQDPQGLQSKQTADNPDDRCDHAGGGAILLDCGILAIEALVTRAVWNIRVDRQQLPFKPNRSA